MFDLPKPFSGAEFDLVVTPYGWTVGDEKAELRRLIVKVESSEGVSGQTGKFAALEGQNALVWIEKQVDGASILEDGGEYRIRVRVRPADGKGVLFATNISRVE